MNNNIVANPKKEIPSGIEMNDCDYLNSILTLEKNMSNDYSIALNEFSNKELYDEFFNIFKEVKNAQRDLFNMTFKNGWYELEKAEQTKIDTEFNKFNQKLQDINQKN